ncbi:MAG TPA: SEC-C metal-binding domain-containing protein [Woeseiaceae bacterium]|nr:SEC-C metal-binding domain-containing protein [Woeseiaceae bacterium]
MVNENSGRGNIEKPRTEQEIFEELEELCKSPGFAHALAYFCFRDNTIMYADGELKTDDVLQQFSMSRLIRTEISTLIGLARKGELDLTLPQADVVQTHIDRAEALLQEIHNSMMLPLIESFNPQNPKGDDQEPLTAGAALREAIFYGGEGAYQFQYRDLALDKYSLDDDWFKENRGYSVSDAVTVVAAISQVQNEKVNSLMASMAEKSPDEWTFLPAFEFSTAEIASASNVDESVVHSVIESFVAPNDADMEQFGALDDFNPTNAYPIVRVDENEYLLFQHYSLLEAFYETPFFWFIDDSAYVDTAMANRGAFAERFSEQRLQLVFGKERVYKNVEIYDSKNNSVGEIDVLVVFANRAIILQAKSKRLTIAARKGNDNSLRDDFKSAIQDAYDQSASCAEYLLDSAYRLEDHDGNQIDIDRDFKEVYPFCVVSDHYPALSFQARQFLKFEESDRIKSPFVIDVFLLDVLTEMLQSPLYFLSYINRRVQYTESIMVSHELTCLSYHLKQNLWVDPEISLMHLGDDICADLDLAMLTRRDNAPGTPTPDGILTKYADTTFGKIVQEIEHIEHPGSIDLGFLLLEMSGETIERINDGIAVIVDSHLKDGGHHDFSIGVGEKGRVGLTIHCNSDDVVTATERLDRHCQVRKYDQKAEAWFGVIIEPKTSGLKFAMGLQFPWEQSDDLDKATQDLKKPQILRPGKPMNFRTLERTGRKIGRNEKCPCGSGKKYKKCCLHKSH